MKLFLSGVVMALLLTSCGSGEHHHTPMHVIEGEAQGTTYSIKYLAEGGQMLTKSETDSVLEAIDMSLSVWVKESVISRFNTRDTLITDDVHFLTVFYRGREISELTGGAFHPMVMPLVRAWGFGPEGGQLKDGIDPDSVKALVNYDYTVDPLTDDAYGKVLFAKAPGQQLDVNAYAQGYSVDVLCELLEVRGVSNYMVEIGGELRAKGVNDKGQLWRIGIDKPAGPGSEREMQAVVSLRDMALATSGNYRKFYIKDGKRYSHTIDAKTGRPVDHTLISVTVLAPNCTNADAFATAFMVMGVDATREFISAHPELGLEVYLIWGAEGETWSTWSSEGMKKLITEV